MDREVAPVDEGEDLGPPPATIAQLSHADASRICSGQVVTQLATAVKELLENALDAGATTVDVRLTDWGAEEIVVSDNGRGISPADHAVVALKSFTSKIASFADVSKVQSFGFRGEALAALCELAESVSITTRTAEQEIGAELKFDRAGRLVSSSPAPRAVGTTVAVRRLFAPLPVRRRDFLSSIKQHQLKCVNMLQGYAIAAAGVRLIVSNAMTGAIDRELGGAQARSVAAVGPAPPLSQLQARSVAASWAPAPATTLGAGAGSSVSGASAGKATGGGRSSLSLIATSGRGFAAPASAAAAPGALEDATVAAGSSKRRPLTLAALRCGITDVFGHKFAESLQPLDVPVKIEIGSRRHGHGHGHGHDTTPAAAESPEPASSDVTGLSAAGEDVADSVVAAVGPLPASSSSSASSTTITARIVGFVSKIDAGIGKAQTDRQFAFLNGRPVDLPKLDKAFFETWRSYELTHRAAFALDIQLPQMEGGDHSCFDINVAPDKREVLLAAPVEAALLDAVRSKLHTLWEVGRRTFAESPMVAGSTGAMSAVATPVTMFRPLPAASVGGPAGREMMIGSSGNDTGDVVADAGADTVTDADARAEAGVAATHGPGAGASESTAAPVVVARAALKAKGKRQSILDVAAARNASAGSSVVAASATAIGGASAGLSSAASIAAAPWSQAPAGLHKIVEAEAAAVEAEEASASSKRQRLLASADYSSRASVPSRSDQAAADRDPSAVAVDHCDSDEPIAVARAGPVAEPRDSVWTTDVRAMRAAYTAKARSLAALLARRRPAPTSVAAAGSTDLSVDDQFALLQEATDRADVAVTHGYAALRALDATAELSSARASSARALSDEVSQLTQSQTAGTAQAQHEFATAEAVAGATGVSSVAAAPAAASSDASAAAAASCAAAAEAALTRTLQQRHFLEMSTRVLGQFNLGFIVGRVGAGDVYIVDQHASHEKKRFEELMAHTKLHEQRLLLPRPIELTASEEAVITEHMAAFNANGFHFHVDASPEAAAGHRLRLAAVPFSKGVTFGDEDVRELAAVIAERGSSASTSGLRAREGPATGTGTGAASGFVRIPKAAAVFASRACRSAVMIGDPLQLDRMRRIVADLSRLHQPWNCPHGRPTLRHLVDLRRLGTVLQPAGPDAALMPFP